MAKRNTTSATQVKTALTRFNALRERAGKIGENTNANASERASICSGLLDVLPTIREDNADNGKKVRRILRRLGHRISDSGYTVAFAKAKVKRERKAKVKVDVDANDSSPPTEMDPSPESDA